MEPMVGVACVAAALMGFCLAVEVKARRECRAQRQNARATMAAAGQDEPGAARPAAGSIVVRIMRDASTSTQPRWLRRVAEARVWRIGCAHLDQMVVRAGLSTAVEARGICIARVQCTVAGAACGALAGAVLSPALALVLGAVGAIAGFCSVPLALKRRASERTAGMERHLSEMVEVVVLGLRSGLSFERSFRLYPAYFDTELAASMSRVAGGWDVGLTSREDALRTLEREYDSVLLSRVVGSMVRSLRFGTSVADSLESVASEAREAHRAHMEERVAKVAVKMMLPVGTLILPAMLLLVLGPVLLELVEGF